MKKRNDEIELSLQPNFEGRYLCIVYFLNIYGTSISIINIY